MKFQKLLEITKIKKIIWIDDDFYSESSSGPSDYRLEVRQQVEAILDIEDPDRNEEMFEQLEIDRDPGLPKDNHMMEIEEWLGEVEDNKIIEFANLHNLLNDNTNEMIKFLQGNGDIEVKTLSHSDWEKEKKAILEDTSRKLFLIDKEFEKEGGSKTTGFEIIKEIHSKDGLSDLDQCILFTNIVTSSFKEEERTRQEFLEDINYKASPNYTLKSPSFMVMSKGRMKSTDFSPVEIGLHNSFIRRIIYQVAVGISEKASDASDETIHKLMAANMTEAAKVFFQTTQEEGVSEVELLHRILASGWERSLYQHLSDSSTLSELIHQGREITSISNEATIESDDNEIKPFHELRRREFWMEGDIINNNFLPMRCGDIFNITHRKPSGQAGDDVTKQYILVAPPCELMIRKDGSRKLKEAVLLPIEKKCNVSKSKAEREKGKQFQFVFKEVEASHDIYIVELNNPVSVNLSALDICSFNHSGSLELRSDSTIDKHKVPIGFLLRFRKVQEILAQGKTSIEQSALGSLFNFPPPLLGEPESITLTKLSIADGYINAPVERVRRLSAPHSEQVMNAFYTFRARKAMEYDFAI